ncbi:hypothetical protein ACMFMG_000523 [Clarireedia jacksonii]
MLGPAIFQLPGWMPKILDFGFIYIVILIYLVVFYGVFSWVSYFGFPMTGESGSGEEDPGDAKDPQRTEVTGSRDQNRKHKSTNTNSEKNRTNKENNQQILTETEQSSSALIIAQQKLREAELKIQKLLKTQKELEQAAHEWRLRHDKREEESLQQERFFRDRLKKIEVINAVLDGLVKKLKDQVELSRRLEREQVASMHSSLKKDHLIEDLRAQIARHEERAKEVDAENKEKLKERDQEIQSLKETIHRLNCTLSERDLHINALTRVTAFWEPIMTRWMQYSRIFRVLRDAGFYFCRVCLAWHPVEDRPVHQADPTRERTTLLEQASNLIGESSSSGASRTESAAATRASASPTPEMSLEEGDAQSCIEAAEFEKTICTFKVES